MATQTPPPTSLRATLTDGQTYRSVLFLLTSFPLGLAYFVVTVVGLSLGAGLAVIGIGLPVLFGTLLAVRGIAAVERRRVEILLGRTIQAPTLPSTDGGFLARLRALVGAAATWRSVGYTVFVFGYGVAGFVLSVVGLTVGAVFVSAPVTYDTPDTTIQFGIWEPATLLDALLLVPVGLVVLVAALYACNRLATLGGAIATELLGPATR